MTHIEPVFEFVLSFTCSFSVSKCSVLSLVCCWKAHWNTELKFCVETHWRPFLLQGIIGFEKKERTQVAIVSNLSGNPLNLTCDFTPEPKFNIHYKSLHETTTTSTSDHNHVCFDPCFTLRSWRVSQSACRRISASTSTRTSSRAVRRFAEPLRAASELWPWGSRPPTHPLETP